jgi:hypothetical protein
MRNTKYIETYANPLIRKIFYKRTMKLRKIIEYLIEAEMKVIETLFTNTLLYFFIVIEIC